MSKKVKTKELKKDKQHRKLLLKNLKKYKIDSPCHLYTDYIVESVYPTDDGEIWFLGS